MGMHDAKLSTTLGGLSLKNPLMPGSGPHSGDAARMIYLAREQGLGAIVTKTIAPHAAQVQRPCIAGSNGLIVNCERWSEFDACVWAEKFLPTYQNTCDTPLLASLGYTVEEIRMLIPLVDHYVDGYELNPRYASLDYRFVGELVSCARQLTAKPLWVKMNGASFADPAAYARVCLQNGANGVTAATAIGPNMTIDLAKRRPVIGTPTGFVWSSGPHIKPYALAMIHLIKQAVPEISIIGTGGVSTARDVLEYLLAGADAVQMLSAAMLGGHDTYKKVIAQLPAELERYGFASIDEVKRTCLQLPEENFKPTFPVVDESRCKKCGRCTDNCPYFAITMRMDRMPSIDQEKCFGCGLCESRCPVGAIKGVL